MIAFMLWPYATDLMVLLGRGINAVLARRVAEEEKGIELLQAKRSRDGEGARGRT